jgi:hypothetical protein
MFDEVTALALFAGTVLAAAVAIWILKRLIRQASGGKHSSRRPRFMWVFHVLAFIFIFVPVVMWQLIASPSISGLPALLTMTTAAYGFFHVSTQNRRAAIVLIVVSTAMWIFYGMYEHQMLFWARTVDTPIRVDLLVLAPLLYYSSLLLIRFARVG